MKRFLDSLPQEFEFYEDFRKVRQMENCYFNLDFVRFRLI